MTIGVEIHKVISKFSDYTTSDRNSRSCTAVFSTFTSTKTLQYLILLFSAFIDFRFHRTVVWCTKILKIEYKFDKLTINH